MDKTYCYPGTDVLINLLGIREKARLHKAERQLTALRLYELIEQPWPGPFDFAQLCAIHRHIFQDVYAWAGEVRTVELARDQMFCTVPYIRPQAEKICGELAAEDLTGLSHKRLAARLAYYMSEINAIHPFREGNGRAQREFIRELAWSLGHVVHFTQVGRAEMVSASRRSFLCDYSEMERIFDRILE